MDETLHRDLGALSGKLDLVLENQRQARISLDSLEVRIRALENSRFLLIGIIAVFSLLSDDLFNILREVWAK